MMLAWLTLIGAAIGVRERTHFTLHVLRLSPAAQVWANRVHHVLIAVFGGLTAWYGVKLCLLNRTLVTPGLEINLAVLYASAVVGGVLLVDLRHLDDRGAAAARSRHRAAGGQGRMILLVGRGDLRRPDRVLHADRLCARRLGRRRPVDRRLRHAGAVLEHGVGLAELGAARHPGLRLRRRADGKMRHEPCPGRFRPRPGRLGQGRARHVGDRGRLFLLRHLRLEDGRGLGAGLDPDAAAHQGRLQARRFGVADRGRHGDGHAGAARHLHDRDRPGHQHLGGGAVPRRLRARPPPSWCA